MKLFKKNEVGPRRDKGGRDSLNEILIEFTENSDDGLTVRDACEGIQVFGGTGSGKTSGSGRALAGAFLRAGFGGLVLTAKPDERDLWRAYCDSFGRSDDFVVLEPDLPGVSVSLRNTINFLEYEATKGQRADGRVPATTYDLVSLLTTAMQAGEQRQSREPFWDEALRQLLTNAIDFLRAAGEPCSVQGMVRLVKAAPASATEADEWWWGRWLSRPGKEFVTEILRKAIINYRDGGLLIDPYDYEAAKDYWTYEFPQMNEKTRSSLVAIFMAKATALLRSPFRGLLCSGTTGDGAETRDITPEATLKGRILVLNLPVKQFGETGRMAQVLYKTIWQRAVEEARVPGRRPVFLWADEAQYFVTEADMAFQQTARSSRCATVYLTQSISNYHAALGESQGACPVTNSLMSNLQTKIFHMNSDPVTNEWAQSVFGEIVGRSQSESTGATVSSQVSQAMVPIVSSLMFSKLRKGGPRNDCCVDGFVYRGGHQWQGGSPVGDRMKARWTPGSMRETALCATFRQQGPE